MVALSRTLFSYDKWAIDRSLRTIDASKRSEAALLLSHVLLAEKIWLTRLRGEDSWHIPTFEELTLDDCEKMADEVHRGYLEFIDSLTESDLERSIPYKNTKGVDFETPVREILMHVGLHGAYHRGQIAWLVRAGGGDAVNTDYITFTRI